MMEELQLNIDPIPRKVNLLIARQDGHNIYGTFSNIGNENKHEFYLLLLYIIVKKKNIPYGGTVTVTKCNRALKTLNKNFFYGEVIKDKKL